jgi:hypothetical protein
MAQLVVSIGASKAGTTTLFELMRQHPSVAVTTTKETNFFFDDALYARGYAWFLATYFADAAGRTVLFEADNAYMCSRTSLQRIKDCDARARIVVMLRNPAERAFSQWAYHWQMGRSRESFEEAIARESARITASAQSVNRWGYLERGRYGKYLAQLFEIFPSEQVRCVLFERLMNDQVGEFSGLTQWLGLPRAAIAQTHENPTGRARSRLLARILYDEDKRSLRRALARPFGSGALKGRVLAAIKRHNVASYRSDGRPRLDPRLRRSILEDLEDDMALAERLTGLDLSPWRAEVPAAA